jgi:hypothetical protein
MKCKYAAMLGIALAVLGFAGAFGLGARAQSTAPGELFPGATGADPLPKAPARPAVSPASGDGSAASDGAAPRPATNPAPTITVRTLSSPSAPADPSPPPAPAPAKRVAPPAAAAVGEAVKLLNEVYKTELAGARTAELKAALAKKLLDAGQAEKDAAGRWAIFAKARDLAVEAGDIEGVASVIEALDASFEIDALKMSADTTQLVARSVRTPAQRKDLVLSARKLVDAAIAADRYDIARAMSELCLNTARAINDADLIKDAAAAVQSVKEVETAYADAKKAAEALAVKPTDPDANLKLGRFRGFYKADWLAGLPLLELGSDKSLAELAKLDLANPASAEDQVKAGDGWWDLSQTFTGLAAANLQHRAAMYYALALPQLSGLAKAKLEKRLKEIGANQPAAAAEKADGPDAVAQILARIPKEMFPAKDDMPLDLQAKSAKIRLWMSRNVNLDRATGGAVVSVAARYTGSNVFTTSSFSGVAERQRLMVNFRQQSEVNGVPCNTTMMIERSITGTDDPTYKYARSLDKDQKNSLVTISAKVTQIDVNLQRFSSSYDSSGRLVSPADTPSVSITLVSTQGDWIVKPRNTPEKSAP